MYRCSNSLRRVVCFAEYFPMSPEVVWDVNSCRVCTVCEVHTKLECALLGLDGLLILWCRWPHAPGCSGHCRCARAAPPPATRTLTHRDQSRTYLSHQYLLLDMLLCLAECVSWSSKNDHSTTSSTLH